MNKKYVYMLATGHFFCDISMGALPAILPFFIANYGMNYQYVAGLMFASCFLASIVQPAFGWIADRKSKTWLMPLGILLSGFAMGLSGVFENYWAIFIAVTVSGIGSSIFHPEAARIVNKLSGSKKGTALSLFSVGGNGGYAVGPIIAVTAVSAIGIKGTMIFCLLALIMSSILMMIIPKIKNNIVSGEEKILDSKFVDESKYKNDWSSFGRLTFLIIFSSIVICGLRSFIPLYLVNVVGISTAAAGSALTLLFMLGVVTTLIGGFLADKIGYLKIVKFSSILLVPMVGLLSQTTSSFVAYLLMIPIGFTIFMPFSSIVVLGQSYLARNIGFASGVTLGLTFSTGGIFVPIIGSFADNHGLPSAMVLLTVIALIAAVASLFLSKPKLPDVKQVEIA